MHKSTFIVGSIVPLLELCLTGRKYSRAKVLVINFNLNICLRNRLNFADLLVSWQWQCKFLFRIVMNDEHIQIRYSFSLFSMEQNLKLLKEFWTPIMFLCFFFILCIVNLILLLFVVFNKIFKYIFKKHSFLEIT